VVFADLPAWQRRGTGVSWQRVAHRGFDPVRAVGVETTRRRLRVDDELPMKADYAAYVRALLA
jgi:tRNA(His) guanylyltransferase